MLHVKYHKHPCPSRYIFAFVNTMFLLIQSSQCSFLTLCSKWIFITVVQENSESDLQDTEALLYFLRFVLSAYLWKSQIVLVLPSNVSLYHIYSFHAVCARVHVHLFVHVCMCVCAHLCACVYVCVSREWSTALALFSSSLPRDKETIQRERGIGGRGREKSDRRTFQNIWLWNFGGRCYIAPNICCFVAKATPTKDYNNEIQHRYCCGNQLLIQQFVCISAPQSFTCYCETGADTGGDSFPQVETPVNQKEGRAEQTAATQSFPLPLPQAHKHTHA